MRHARSYQPRSLLGVNVVAINPMDVLWRHAQAAASDGFAAQRTLYRGRQSNPLCKRALAIADAKAQTPDDVRSHAHRSLGDLTRR